MWNTSRLVTGDEIALFTCNYQFPRKIGDLNRRGQPMLTAEPVPGK
jgi:hypothetical protein